MTTIYLKAGRDKSVRNRHPWIFSGAIDRIDGNPASGDEVRVAGADKTFLARGFYSATAQIRCRLFRWRDEAIDAAFFRHQLEAAITARKLWIGDDTDAYRIINAEGDGLPGLVVDKYADVLVVQFSHAGVERLKQAIIDSLIELLAPRAIYEKSDGNARGEEGLPAVAGVLHGELPEASVQIREHGLRFHVDIGGGQKTGFYLDQRENRALMAHLAAGRAVLDGFAYSGGFTVAALAGGARSVITVDASRHALELARRNVKENGFEMPEANFIAKDVFNYIRETDGIFDLINLDPPSLARQRHAVQNASRAYKDVNLHAMKRLTPGGLLLTSSCSQHISPDLLQKILFAAASDAGRAAKVLREGTHAPDHPINIYHPEGRYLHSFLLQVD